jgi:hypothetical protein
VVASIVDAVPDVWLGEDPAHARERYVEFLERRLAAPRAFAEEAERVRREVAA